MTHSVPTRRSSDPFAPFKPIKEWWDLHAFNDIDMSGIGAPAADVCGKVETKKADGNQEHVESGVDVEYTDAPPAFGKHENTPDTPDRKLYTKDDRPRVEIDRKSTRLNSSH